MSSKASPGAAGPASAPPSAPGASQRLGALAADLGQAGRYLAQSFRLMVGVPDYGGFVAHMQATHPEQAPMSYEAFFRERQAARYGSKVGRCC